MPSSVLSRMFRGPAGTLLFVRLYCTLVVLATGLGVVVLFGGENRFSAPGFAGARALVSFVPVKPYVAWGLIFLAYGLALLAALGKRAAVHVLRFGMMLYIFFAIGLLKSVLDSPITAATGVVVYGCCMLFHAFLSDYLDHNGWE